ncbi:MAG: hypothetical protein JW781_06720 [Deltaproteobacteria bacterium]|nr:hypothetical protein [Candidatus Anaeroferrophillacea bacterium]
MKRLAVVLAIFMTVALAAPAFAADVKVRGDFNNRFMVYTNHADWLEADQKSTLGDDEVDESWGEAKYRMWVEASSNDGKVKGYYAFEIGSLEYGDESKGAGGYSGDGMVHELRWAYTDFQLPWYENKARIKMGLQPFKVNSFLWAETAMGVVFDGAAGSVDYTLGWVRPWNDKDTVDDATEPEDLDSFYGRVNFKPMDGVEAGIFALYMTGDDDVPGGALSTTGSGYEVKSFKNNFDMDILTVGTDGKFANGNFFGAWDLMYQDGSIDATDAGDYDLSAYFAHVDLGYKMDKMKLTYTFWYASGDDDDDDDLDAFLSIDVDRMDNVVIFEGGFTDDDYFTERPYILDKGFIMNKLALDYKASKKMTLGASLMYMMTAEDVEYVDDLGRDRSDDSIGTEIDAYMKYKIYDDLEFALNAGYLFADDAIDYFEADRDGNSDEDIFISTARVRYKF